MTKELKKDLEAVVHEFLFEPCDVKTKNEIKNALLRVLHRHDISEKRSSIIMESFGSQITVCLHLDDRLFECNVPGEFIELQD